MTYYFDMDGVLADFHSNYTDRAQAFSREYLANLAPFTANIATVKALITKGERVYILTKAACEDAKQGKRDWLAKWLPEVAADNFICIVGNGRKVDYIREAGVLVDDDPRNTRPWVKGGYTAVLLSTKGEAVAL
jgi:5'(3')-deoxyribonucleotidase